MGEVAERSEGRRGYMQTLSVACGDSSPKGRAKALCKTQRLPHSGRVCTTPSLPHVGKVPPQGAKEEAESF